MRRSDFVQQTIIALAPFHGTDEEAFELMEKKADMIANKYDSIYSDFDPEGVWVDGPAEDGVERIELPVDFSSGIASFSPGDGEVKVSIHDDWVEGKEWAAKQKMDGPGDFDAVFDKMANPEVVQFTDKARAGAYAYISSRATELLRQKSLAADVGMDIMGARAQSEGMELPTMLVVGADVDAFQLNIPMKESVRIQRGEYKIVLHRL